MKRVGYHLLAILLLIYITTFVSAYGYTKPSLEDAPFTIRNGFMKFYTVEQGHWTPLTKYHTTVDGGYYSVGWNGKWNFINKQLKLKGLVEISWDKTR